MRSYSTWRLALTNMKKSISDYAVYFITLVLGVTIFYIFNAIGDQALVLNLSQSGYEIIEIMIGLMTGMSICVAAVLGFLILYANQFLIKRRKKEFGVYLLLGMGKRQVSHILFCETLLTGLISLAIGLMIGIFGSQFLSILVAKFYEADLSSYRFSFSLGAFVKTILCYVVMNLVVVAFHAVSITRIQLVSLLSAGKKTEKQYTDHAGFWFFLFVLSASVLGFAYYRVGFCADELYRSDLICLILVGIVANMVLFRALAGFLMIVFRRFRWMYLSKLNAFVMRQLCCGINSSSISMGIICLMLFATIVSFVTGISVANQFQTGVREKTPVDFSIVCKTGERVSDWFHNYGSPISTWAKDDYVEVPVYQISSIRFLDTLGSGAEEIVEQYPQAIIFTEPVDIMRLSDYNNLMSRYGKEKIELNGNEYRVACDWSMVLDYRNKALQEKTPIRIGTITLNPAAELCDEQFVIMSLASFNAGTFIIPDNMIDTEQSEASISAYIAVGDYCAMTRSQKKATDDWLNALAADMLFSQQINAEITLGTKIAIRESNNGLVMLVSFLVVYMGVVFMLASAAILSLKTLSDTVDSVERFQILRKLGCDSAMMKKGLFIQVGSFFLVPVSVALLHSIFGIRFAGFLLNGVLKTDLKVGILMTFVFMVLFYGSYMIAAMRSSKRIVNLDKET